MQVEIVHGPGSSAARIGLQINETVTAEAGSMIAMTSGVSIKTTTHKKSKGGILKAAKRLLAGESFFMNHFTGHQAGDEVIVSAALPGDMMVRDLQNETLIVQGGSFVAAEEQVDIDMGWQGFKSFFSGENAFWLHMKGSGKVVLSSYGAIYPIEVTEPVIVDTGHIVAFTEALDFTVTKAGKSWVSSILGGEGLVCKFHGRGTVWCQSHNDKSFGQLLGPMLRPRN